MTSGIEEQWDFYPCRVDDRPASIFLNFRYADNRPPQATTMYYAVLRILEPGPHGMGMEPDASKLWDIEDAITAATGAAGLLYVGRLRNNGGWQLTFYGPSGMEAALRAILVEKIDGRAFRTGCKSDPEWRYFSEFLMPDRERMQWIMDRRVIHQLKQAGDNHDVVRTIDHCLIFESVQERDACARVAHERG